MSSPDPCRRDLPDTPDRPGVVDAHPQRDGVNSRRMPAVELEQLDYVGVPNGGVIDGPGDGERIRALQAEFDINLDEAR